MKHLAKYLFAAYIVATLGVFLYYCTGCAVPAIGQIDLAGCTNMCNEGAKVCFENSNMAAEGCLTPDSSSYDRTQCIEYQTKQGEQCINDLVSCESDCIAATQKQLGGK